MRTTIVFRTRLISAAAMFTLAAGAVEATVPSLTLLGDLPGGTFRSEGLGCSADGLIAVGRSWVEPNAASYEAFRWTPDLGMVSLGDFPGGTVEALANDADLDGSVIVGSSRSANGEEAFIWTEATGLVGLGDLPDTSFFSRARAVNGDGTIVVGSHLGDAAYPAVRKPWVWTSATGMVSLGTAVIGGEANDISRTGLVIVGYTATSGVDITPKKWTVEDGWVALGNFPGGSSRGIALATNTDGSIIVGASGNPQSYDPFLWTQATGMVSLGQIPGVSHSGPATGVNFDGSRVVGGRSWIWTPGTGIVRLTPTLRNIYGMDVPGLITGEPRISDDGHVIIATLDGNIFDPVTETFVETSHTNHRIACRIVLPGTGACCIGGGCVDDVDPIACSTFCGIFVSDESTCATIACATLGACAFHCALAAPATCPDPINIVSNRCVVLTEDECAAAGGQYIGGDCNCAEPSMFQCAADLTGDGVASIADFTVLAANFGQGAPDCKSPWEGDLNCDGVVNTADFTILAGDFGCGN